MKRGELGSLFAILLIAATLLFVSKNPLMASKTNSSKQQSFESGLTSAAVSEQSIGLAEVEPEVIQAIQAEGKARVIVLFKDQNSRDTRNRFFTAQEIISTLDAAEFQPRHRFSSIPGFSGNISMAGLQKLRNNPAIQRIVLDLPVYALLQNTVPLINASAVHGIQIGGQNITGQGQTICIVDTGIDYTHPDLGGCFGAGCKVVAGYDFVNDDSDPMDDNGHGTHVAGIAAANGTIRGVAPGARLVAMKALNSIGGGSASDIVASIDWCKNNATLFNITVISLSLGGGAFDTPCDSQPEAAAANAAVAAGLFVAAASGNSGSSTYITSPACASNVTAVAASTNSDSMAQFSQTNSLVDLVAPGVGVNSTRLGGGYLINSGTSMATPHVAGTAALMQQYQRLQSGTNLTPSEVTQILQREAGAKVTDNDNGLTFSRIDALKAANALLVINQTANKVERPGAGSVVFDSPTDLSGASAAFVIGNNTVFLNSSAFPKFNKSATIQLLNLLFQKTPVVFKDGTLCQTPLCNITSYSSGTLAFHVAGFTNYSAGANANLVVWDEGDSGQPFFEGQPRAGNPISFFANYTNRSSGAVIPSASCNITYPDGSSAMSFNSTKQVFEHTRIFDTSQFFSYPVTCADPAFEPLTATDSIQILSNSSGCTYPGPNINWTIETDSTVICANETILLINQSINVLDNATFMLDSSELTLNVTQNNIFNIGVAPNATIVVINSLIRSLDSSVKFRLDIFGYGNITNSLITNGTQTYLGGNKSHYITNSIFGDQVRVYENSNNFFTNVTFAAPIPPSIIFYDLSNNTLQNISVYGEAQFRNNSINLIRDSNFTNETRFIQNTTSRIANSSFKVVRLANSPILNFTNLSTITNEIMVLTLATPLLDGFVDMPNSIVLPLGAVINRFLPIQVLVNGTNITLSGRSVNITNTTSGTLVNNGSTDANGFVYLNATFTNTSFGIGNFTVATNPSQPLGLLTDTPIILQVSDTNLPNISLTSPPNNSLFASGILIELKYIANDTTSELANCSLILNSVLNQTHTSPQENTEQTFIVNLGEGTHSWRVECTDSSAQANVGSSETRILTVDGTPPSVFDPKPAPNSTFKIGTTIEVAVNATDNVAVDTVYANITLPNGTLQQLILALATGSKYNNSFTIPALTGLYNITYFANDTSGNANTTTTTNFTATNQAPSITLYFPLNNTQFNNTQTVTF
ncbi:MAG: S8 family serine peptidase, partial [Candidatus Woesearchaeota archaeon]